MEIKLSTPKDRIAALRSKMENKKIDAFIVFSADPHMSEYLPDEWQERKWLTGFTGSAGFVVITKDKAALWTDGRYFVQAPKELEGSGIELMKMGEDGVLDYTDWIKKEINEKGIVAVNAIATSHNNWLELEQKLSSKNIKLVDNALLKDIWTERQSKKTKSEIYIHPVNRAGKSANDKISDIRNEMKALEVSFHIISSLDDVAWTLNLRGNDVDYNPVFLGYITVSETETTLYVDLEKVNDEISDYLKKENVQIKPYESFFDDLKNIENEKVLISPNSNQSIFDTVKGKNQIIKAATPGNLMKAQKNDVELEGFRTVMQRDGVAMVKFLYWLKHNVGKEEMTEYSIGKKLKSFRAEGKNFVGESFGSIIGYEGNGAIVHYSAKEQDCKKVTNIGSILIDSGGQYLEGTTDITRTVAIGNITEEFRRDFTLVLKGMIQLSMIQFPKGTRGVQLDTIARLPLWTFGKDYNHGTGHGVGSFMNVHEGPQNIRKELNPQELLVGMVCSNEPGFYVENQYGIRHENLVAVKNSESTAYGTFYEFETLTICPFDRETILVELLSDEEKQWINNYHKWCEEKLSNELEGDVKKWFLEQVKSI